MVLSLAASGAVLAWCRRASVSPVLAGAAALLVCLPAPVVHAVSLTNREAPVQMAITSPLANRALLEPVLTGNAALAANLNDLVLTVPARSTGYLALMPQDPAGWDLPRALVEDSDAPVAEELTFTASVERDGTYFILL